MRKSATLILALAAVLLSGGCDVLSQKISRTDSVQPGGGSSLIFNRPYEIVFAAVVRVMNLNEQDIREADSQTGRIVAVSGTRRIGVFVEKFSDIQTRVEITSNIREDDFFSQLREQIIVYEKKKALKAESERIALEKKAEENAPLRANAPRKAIPTEPVEQPQAAPAEPQRRRYPR
ncbi:MAG: hypothetical protein O2807_00375 [bacterium]|nr:hypothetical protein [bacterium]